jgi:DNA-binding response OmpR family regulator
MSAPLSIVPVSDVHVEVAGRPVELANLEYELLLRLASEPTRVFSKQQLLRDIWGHRVSMRTRTLDSHACRLRTKLAAAGGGRWVQTVWGFGYRLCYAVEEPERDGSAA